ncbi:MAG: NADP-dependent isocitrate dehydrogenase [Oscillospiraceae bacterium]|jgi:isocitrate dehydrogenase|nr:NADP-dependent isocitrate dehydrogenase [Oscillospiraceae bacterium]
MSKIKMTTPIVEIDGDEMTRVLWQMIKDELISPYIDLKTEYFDLGLQSRNDTDDRVTTDAANATKRLGVAVKCATITPNKQKLEEFPWLKKMYKSPNATLRSILDGTVFRAPITVPCIKPSVKTWEKPITIARHAYGDIYAAVELHTDEPGMAELIFTGSSGKTERVALPQLDGPAVLAGYHNKDASIRSFAKACFAYALDTKQDLWFSTKDTIAKIYDGRFKEIFEEEYAFLKAELDAAGVAYFYTLIDDAAARIVRSRGGVIWAMKNYDGDVMSDLLSAAFGSLAMMTSVLVSPDGCFEYEAAHGTVSRHYHRYLKGEETSTNPTATIFAWSGALKKRGEIDGLPELSAFGARLEAATVAAITGGTMTRDLAPLTDGSVEVKTVNSAQFIAAIRERL